MNRGGALPEGPGTVGVVVRAALSIGAGEERARQHARKWGGRKSQTLALRSPAEGATIRFDSGLAGPPIIRLPRGVSGEDRPEFFRVTGRSLRRIEARLPLSERTIRAGGRHKPEICPVKNCKCETCERKRETNARYMRERRKKDA